MGKRLSRSCRPEARSLGPGQRNHGREHPTGLELSSVLPPGLALLLPVLVFCNSVFSLILSALQKQGQAKLPERTLCSHSPSFARFFFDFRNMPTLHPSHSTLHCPNCPPLSPQSRALQPSSWLCGGQDSSPHGSLLAPATSYSFHIAPTLAQCLIIALFSEHTWWSLSLCNFSRSGFVWGFFSFFFNGRSCYLAWIISPLRTDTKSHTSVHPSTVNNCDEWWFLI